MKQFITVLICFTLFAACSSSKKVVSKSVYDSLVGQNQFAILKAMGTPTQIEHTRNGGKIMVYEYTETGMFLTPKEPKFKYDFNKKQLSYTSTSSRVTNAPEFTIYQKNTSKFKAYINEKGTCYKVDGSLPQEYMETHYERFKHYK